MTPTPIISRMTLIQPGDSCDHRDNLQELNIEFHSEGATSSCSEPSAGR